LLCEHGIVLVKFWLQIDRDEQARRFAAREKVPYKQYKITEEDYRNRGKWEQYEAAVHDMVEQTSGLQTPWTLVEANDKYFARIKVLRTICDRLQAAVERRSRRVDDRELYRWRQEPGRLFACATATT
jgi:AMP-polyphosphate phosphotransferase